MKYLFIVQGEGRGHMTQAIALKQLIEANGGTVVKVILGTSPGRKVSDYFLSMMEGKIEFLSSPNFIKTKNEKRVAIIRTGLFILRNVPLYLKNIYEINKIVKHVQPDVIINFFDILGGVYSLLWHPSCPIICIAHQYTFLHEKFKFPNHFLWQRLSLLVFIKMTALRANAIFALSFYPLPNEAAKKLYVIPPLLRKVCYQIESAREDFILIYLLNSGLSEELIQWHNEHREIKIYCFWDKLDAPGELRIDDNLVFFQINDRIFMELLSRCRGFISTAGFESIAEAYYLKKPVCVVPVKGHIEQRVNAFDMESHNISLSSEQFEFSKFVQYIHSSNNNNYHLREWWLKENQRILELINNTVHL